SGIWRPPVLIDSGAEPNGRTLPNGVAANLSKVMRLVVTEGTGTAANISGQDVHGKTGTAEFGSGDQTHAWFVGFRGNLAFAVLVPAGGVGGQVAAPIAARFLRAL